MRDVAEDYREIQKSCIESIQIFHEVNERCDRIERIGENTSRIIDNIDRNVASVDRNIESIDRITARMDPMIEEVMETTRQVTKDACTHTSNMQEANKTLAGILQSYAEIAPQKEERKTLEQCDEDIDQLDIYREGPAKTVEQRLADVAKAIDAYSEKQQKEREEFRQLRQEGVTMSARAPTDTEIAGQVPSRDDTTTVSTGNPLMDTFFHGKKNVSEESSSSHQEVLFS
jgi:chromosome segregation ATPase